MFAEIAELFLCKIFQIVIKFMNQNKLLSQRQHQGRAWTWLDCMVMWTAEDIGNTGQEKTGYTRQDQMWGKDTVVLDLISGLRGDSSRLGHVVRQRP